MRSWISLLYGLLLIMTLGFGRTIAADAPAPPTVWVLNIDGVINPLSARYLRNHLRDAHRGPMPGAIILELNTPGGLESSMREMIQDMLASRIPIAVYVTPQGGHAASAGMFLTVAAHIATMAPGTNIGAAHPVILGGGPDNQDEQGVAPMAEKVVNDSAALARSLALERGRNTEWIESAVRKSVSITATEAASMNVVDWVSPNRAELLARLDGKKVKTAAGLMTIRTRDAAVIEKEMNLAERILHAITDPNIAYLLLTIGFIGLLAELYSPGMIFPGVTGVISLLLAFAAMGSLPINWVGLALLGLGIGLLILELQTEGFGFLGIGASVAFVLGSLILYRPLEVTSPSLPRVALNPWLLTGVTLFLLGFMGLVLRAVIRSRHLPIASGPQALVGLTATVTEDLAPRGRVRLGTEEWSAALVSEEPTIAAGTQVEIVAVEGVTLVVRQKQMGRRLQAS